MGYNHVHPRIVYVYIMKLRLDIMTRVSMSAHTRNCAIMILTKKHDTNTKSVCITSIHIYLKQLVKIVKNYNFSNFHPHAL